MSDAAMDALAAAETRDKAGLLRIGDQVVMSCEGCHDAFKPSIPSEGMMHEPDYDYLHHLFR